MKITLYKGITKRKNSTMLPEDSPGLIIYKEVEVVLKANTSRENPVFLIEGNDFGYNYVKWDDHYYFIDDIVSTARNLTELHCSQDVLATYKTEIGEHTTFVSRASNVYDTFLNDNAISIQQPIIANSVTNTIMDIFGDDPRNLDSYLVRVVSGNGSCIAGYVFQSLDELQPILNPSKYFIDSSDEDVNWLSAIGRVFFDPTKYILNVYRTPIPYSFWAQHLTESDALMYIKWFNTDIEALKQNVVRWSQEFTINIPTLYYNDFRDFNPNFVKYNIYLPGVGTQSLPSEYMNSPLKLRYMIDLETGDIFYELKNINYTSQSEAIVSTFMGNIYANIQIGKTGATGKDIMEASNSSTVGQITGKILSGVTDIVHGITSVTSPNNSVNGTQSSAVSIKLEHKIIISRTIHGSGEIPLEVAGRPLCRNVQLKTIPGFIQCEGASIPIAGLSSDRDAVNNYLNGGFYYE